MVAWQYRRKAKKFDAGAGRFGELQAGRNYPGIVHYQMTIGWKIIGQMDKMVLTECVVSSMNQQKRIITIFGGIGGNPAVGQIIPEVIRIIDVDWFHRDAFRAAKITNFVGNNWNNMGVRYKTGDRVRFLNDVGGGVVTRIDSQGMVLVQTPDGFEIPVQAGDLVPAQGFDISAEETTPVTEVKAPPVKEKPASGTGDSTRQKLRFPANIPADATIDLWLGFVPENQGPVFHSPVGCYLINDSPYFAYYRAGTWERGNYYYLSSGLVEADTKSLLGVFDQTAISKIYGFHLQLILVSEGRYFRRAPVDALVDVHVVNFSKESYYRENDFFVERAVLFPVMQKGSIQQHNDIAEIPDEVKAEKGQALSGSADNQAKKRDSNPETLEIDLHMDEQDLSQSHYSQQSILALQMSRFHAGMEEAVSKKIKRIVFIHGVGQGTLKAQLRKELQEKYPSCEYQDASFKEYGFGATLVYIRKEKGQ
jgi:DNA-nicking Smr family endonuclease